MKKQGYWAKLLVSKTDWKNHYSQHNYTYLGEVDNKVVAGFLTVDKPDGRTIKYVASDEEILIMDNHRRAMRIHPLPLESNVNNSY
jgi:hypothetical protein